MSNPVPGDLSLEEQFELDTAEIERQWEAAQPFIQSMLAAWNQINEREINHGS